MQAVLISQCDCHFFLFPPSLFLPGDTAMVGDLEVEVGPSHPHPEVTGGTGRGREEVGGQGRGHRDDEGLGAETVVEESQLPVTEAAWAAGGVAGVPLLLGVEAAEPARPRKRKLLSALLHLRSQSPKRKREITRPVHLVPAVLLKTNHPSKQTTVFSHFRLLHSFVSDDFGIWLSETSL